MAEKHAASVLERKSLIKISREVSEGITRLGKRERAKGLARETLFNKRKKNISRVGKYY